MYESRRKIDESQIRVNQSFLIKFIKKQLMHMLGLEEETSRL